MDDARPPGWWGATAALALPLGVVGPTLGSWKTPGVRAEPLFETLVGAHESWLTASPLGTAALRLFTFFLDPISSLGALDFVGLWLAGYGGWRLGLGAKTTGPAWIPAAVGMAALQLSPMVLRGLCTGEVGVLALGFGALALALGRVGALFALLATLWCWPVGLVALLGRWRCWRTWALVLPALALLALMPASEEAGSLRRIPREAHVVSGYVTEAGAVLPLPAVVAPEPHSGGPRQGVRGLYGGFAAMLGVIAGLWLGPRAAALGGLAVAALLFAGLGPLPSPEVPAGSPAPWMAALALPGLGGQGVPWGAAVSLAGAVGLVSLAARGRNAAIVGLFAVAISALVENPRLALPVANLPPDPGINALRSVAPGALVVFPSPLPPFLQGTRGEAEHRWYALSHDRDEAALALAAPVIGQLSAIASVPVDIGAAELLWAQRAVSLDEVRAQGVPYLLLDRRSLPAEGKGPLEGWLATHIGPPLAEGEDYALYTFEMEGQDDKEIK